MRMKKHSMPAIMVRSVITPLLAAVFLVGTWAAIAAAGWDAVPVPTYQGEEITPHLVPLGADEAVGVAGQIGGTYSGQVGIFHYVNGAWTTLDVSALPITPGFTVGVAAGTGPDNIWISGTYDPPGFYRWQIYLAHWDGSSWEMIPPGDVGGDCYEMIYRSDTDITILAGQSSIWHYDGDSFLPMDPPAPAPFIANYLNSGDRPAASQLWTVGSGRHRADIFHLLIDHWTGTAWESWTASDVNLLEHPATSQTHLDGVVAFSDSDVWAVGRVEDGGQAINPLYLHFDGDTWTEVAGPGTGGVGPAVRVGPDEAWAIGKPPAGASLVMHHLVGGTWSTEQVTPAPAAAYQAYLTRLDVAADGSVWAVGTWIELVDGGQVNHPLLRRYGSRSTGIGSGRPSPRVAVQLAPPSPNPFNPATELRFRLPRDGNARLDIVALDGSIVDVLVDGFLPAGEHRITWQAQRRDGRSLPSGTYFARLATNGGTATTRLMLVK